jgi:hypothetical protein
MASPSRGRLFGQIRIGKERIVERIRELKAAGIGEISFRLLNDGAPEKSEGLDGRFCRVINQPLQRVGAELTGLSTFMLRNQPAAQLGSSILWIDYRRRRSPPMDCRASSSMSRTFP